MTLNAPPTVKTGTAPSEERDENFATCPLCHTVDGARTLDSVTAGNGWQCARCGQKWDAARLSAVAAYAVWVAENAPPAPSA